MFYKFFLLFLISFIKCNDKYDKNYNLMNLDSNLVIIAILLIIYLSMIWSLIYK